MRKQLIALALFSACDSSTGSSIAIAGNALIAVDEGDTLEVEVTGAAGELAIADRPDWVSIDQTRITLAPHCSLVRGTSGPPQLFELEVSDGHGVTPLTVQVRPSGAGTCTPRMRTCIRPGSVCAQDAPIACEAGDPTIVPDPIVIDDSPDPRTLVLTVDSPDTTDTVFGHPTTDAPLELRATKPTAPTTFCAAIPNHDVVGVFTLSYSLARDPQGDTGTIATGATRFKWNVAKKVGVELATCASSGPPCTIARIDRDTWCIDATAPADRTIGIRPWLSQAGAQELGGSIRLRVTPAVPLASATAKAKPAIALTYGSEILTDPPLVAADLGTAAQAAYAFDVLDGAGAIQRAITVRVQPSCP